VNVLLSVAEGVSGVPRGTLIGAMPGLPINVEVNLSEELDRKVDEIAENASTGVSILAGATLLVAAAAFNESKKWRTK
jgi:hypothetical protein